MTTSLHLLTQDGAIMVTFAAVLTPSQYSRFFDCVQQSGTKEQMIQCVQEFARESGLEVLID